MRSHGNRQITVLCLFALFRCLAPVVALGAEPNYLTILVPGALGTFPMSINNAMTVTGYYTTSPSTASAFIRNAAGTITTFSVRGGLWTEPESINDAGDITGFYEVVAYVPQTFIRYANGRVVTFDPPPAGCTHEPASQPVAINAFDEVAGNYPAPCFGSSGFTRSRTGTLDADVFNNHLGSSYPTGVLGLNSSGTVIGFVTNTGYIGGFFLGADGYGGVVSVSPPPDSGEVRGQITVPEAINDEGVIIGEYAFQFSNSTKNINGAFVRSPQGSYTFFNPPGTLLPPSTYSLYLQKGLRWSAPQSLSLNASGVIAGTYTDAGGARHGFVRNPYGTITPFDPPNGMQTTVSGINDSGIITGTFFYDWNSQTSIGFLRIPKEQSEDGAIKVVAH